jgi:hypothetical protein
MIFEWSRVSAVAELTETPINTDLSTLEGKGKSGFGRRFTNDQNFIDARQLSTKSGTTTTRIKKYNAFISDAEPRSY